MTVISESTAAPRVVAGTENIPSTTAAGWEKNMHDELTIVLTRPLRRIVSEDTGDRQRIALRRAALERWSACLSPGRS